MDIIITPGKLTGRINIIPSKSQAHRLLICAAFADKPTTILCPETSRDMDATAHCLCALGADIQRTDNGYYVIPVSNVPEEASLPCRDSGSTLRFLLPIAGALGVRATFLLEGRLPQRPLSPLWEEMIRMGCELSRPTPDTILCQGCMRPGEYRIDGGISSQFITGLLMAAALLSGPSKLTLLGKVESVPYIRLTQQAMRIFGVDTSSYSLCGGHAFLTPGTIRVEGDWSNGAFFLAAQSLGNEITVDGLSPESVQGDREAASLLPALKVHQIISASDIPDLVPILAVTAACNQGAVFTNIQRLRLKESDRVATVVEMIQSLGGSASADEETLTIFGGGLKGGTVNSHNDHRIAMAASIAATCCQDPVIVLGAECVEKSYPKFYDEYRRLGGTYEQYLR